MTRGTVIGALGGTAGGNDRPPQAHNRDVFDDELVVGNYSTLTDLSAAEAELFDRHIAPGSRILDLGVGTGRTTPQLATSAGEYLGVDIAPRMVECARALHPTHRFEVMDASDLAQLADGSFDVVVFSYNGLDYVVPEDRRARAVAEIRRVLVPGGTLIFSTHDPRAVLRERNRALGWRSWPVVWLQTARRCAGRLGRQAFWRGEGVVLDPVSGGLITYMATPPKVTAALDAAGFTVTRSLPSRHPGDSRRFGTEWWYYVATRR